MGDRYGGLLLWDPQTGKLVRHLKTFGTGLGRVVFSPDGRWVAAQTGGGVHVWEAGTGREVAANDAAHHGAIASVEAAGGLVATSAHDQTVRLWDAATGRQKHVLRHDGAVHSIALSPDGARLVSSSLDDTVRVWDAATGKLVYRLPGHGRLGSHRRPVGFTPDGKRFLSFGDDFFLRVTDTATGKALLEHKIRPTGIEFPDEDDGSRDPERHLGASNGSCLSPDGKALVLATNKWHIFDTATGRERLLDAGLEGSVVSRAVSPDGRHLLTSAWGRPVVTKLPDGRTRYSFAREHPVCLWDLSSGKRVWQCVLPEGGAGPVAFSADGKRCAMAADEPLYKLLVWDTATGKEVAQIPRLPGTVRALAFSTDGKRVYTGMDDTTILIWDLK
jgi:WD40 repeat protein